MEHTWQATREGGGPEIRGRVWVSGSGRLFTGAYQPELPCFAAEQSMIGLALLFSLTRTVCELGAFSTQHAINH